MPTTAAKASPAELLRTLPGDDVRQIMWRFADRYDLQMLVQSTRAVARGPVARLVADGGRNDHEWTERKNELLSHYDASGITAAFMEPEEGGFIAGPKNLALALMAFFVLACQCMSTVAAIRRETKSIRWPAFVLAYTYIAAYVVALGVHALAGMMGVT